MKCLNPSLKKTVRKNIKRKYQIFFVVNTILERINADLSEKNILGHKFTQENRTFNKKAFLL